MKFQFYPILALLLMSLTSPTQKSYVAKSSLILTVCHNCFHYIKKDTSIIDAKFYFTDMMTDKDKKDYSRHYLVSYDMTNPQIDPDEDIHTCTECEDFHFLIWRDLYENTTYFQVRFWINDAYSTEGKIIYHANKENNFIVLQYADGTKDVLHDLNVYKTMFLVKPSKTQIENLISKKIKKITCSNDAGTFANTSIHPVGDTCASYIKDVVKAYSNLSAPHNLASKAALPLLPKSPQKRLIRSKRNFHP